MLRLLSLLRGVMIKRRRIVINFKLHSIPASLTLMSCKDISITLLKNQNSNQRNPRKKYYSCPPRRSFRVPVMDKLVIFFSSTMVQKRRQEMNNSSKPSKNH